MQAAGRWDATELEPALPQAQYAWKAGLGLHRWGTVPHRLAQNIKVSAHTDSDRECVQVPVSKHKRRQKQLARFAS